MLECPDWASPGPPQKVKVHGLGLPYNHKIILIARLALTLSEGSKKKSGKTLVFDQTGGGGLRGYIKNQTPSVIMYFLK